MKIKIIMDSGKEYVVSPKSRVNDISQFIWQYFEKNNKLINELVKIDFGSQQLALNPNHISSIETIEEDAS